MNAQEITNLCIDSATRYYNYLKDNNLGLDRIEIVDKNKIIDSNSLWVLKLAGRVFNSDVLIIKNLSNNTTYDRNHFSIESYSVETNRLVIRVNDTMTGFAETPANQLILISDLKFLVENVRTWYVNNGPMLNLPIVNENAISYQELELDETPNEHQISAIETCLNEPFCYIWGPPGSGKTRLVLASAVLSYYDPEEPFRVGVFAPTNNSLEQIMTVLIILGDKLGISREKFFRLGTPTQQFAADFPEVCEVAGLEKTRNELKIQIRILDQVLEYRKEKRIINSSEALLQSLTDIVKNILHRDEELFVLSKLEKELLALKKKNTSIVSLVKKIVSTKVNASKEHIENIDTQCGALKERVANIEERIELSFAKIKRVQIGNSKIKELVEILSFQNIEEIKEKLQETIIIIKEHLMVRDVHALDYKELAEVEILDRKKQLEQTLTDLDLQNIDERVKGSFVVGSTLDTYISRFQNATLTLDHIFIDEAGYVPLIKALVLCKAGVPITFLGDHKQLPPVCEMNENELAHPLNRNVILWSVPSLYCGSVFLQTRDNLLNNLTNANPIMHVLKKVELKITHRFGSNLAEILDRLIYNFGFRSAFTNGDNCVELFIIDAPFRLGGQGRKNLSEATAIKRFLESVPISDFTILTPYRDQVALIKTLDSSLRREDRVLTVHKSQGREWDTVIMSIVDGRASDPWLTNTLHPVSKGAQVMNTAISRVKKKLFIVCDRTYWLNRNDRERQLVSNLITMGEPYNLI